MNNIRPVEARDLCSLIALYKMMNPQPTYTIAPAFDIMQIPTLHPYQFPLFERWMVFDNYYNRLVLLYTYNRTGQVQYRC